MVRLKFGKKILSFAISVAALLVLVLTSVNVGVQEVYADEMQITLSQIDPSDPQPGEIITFGKAEISAGSAYSGQKVSGLIISVNVGSIITTTDSIPEIPSSVGGVMTDALSDHKTVTCFWLGENGKTIDEIKTLLQTVKYVYAEGMKITITVDTNQTNLPVSDKIKSQI